jgi:fatty-acyl-CoA synthase
VICTVTDNADLPLQLGGFSGLRHALDYAAKGQTGINFHDARGNLIESLDYAGLRRNAITVALRLRAMGLRHGDRLALIADTSAAFLSVFYGAQYAGVVPCPLPYQALPGGREAYVARLSALLVASGASWLLSPRATFACCETAAAVDVQVLPLEAMADAAVTSATELPPVAADVPAYIQFSSGSTATPKGVVVRQQALMANADAIAVHGLRMRAGDRACSWLPLYHDMGLVGFSVVAMCAQRSVDYLPSQVFAARPLAWLELMSRQRSSIVYAPSFAWRLAAQRYPSMATGIDLSALRVAGVGGDQVRNEDLCAFSQALAPAGFRHSAFQPSYGLAEATLAVSMGALDDVPRLERMHDAASGGDVRTLLGCGRPLPGTEVRILDDAGAALPERSIGRLWVRGPAVMERYLHDDDGRGLPRADGFLDTGDLGYLLDGELFISGRAKDLIVVRGRNLWPQDIETVAATAAALATTDVAALGIERGGEERVVVLAECGVDADHHHQQLREQIGDALSTSFGIRAEVVMLPRRSLPFTTSGKLARAQAKTKYLAGHWAYAVVNDREKIC